MSNGKPVKEARQIAAQLIENWNNLNEEEKVGAVSEIVHQLANAESEEETNEEKWEQHNESFSYEPPDLPGEKWSQEQMQELVDRVIRRQTNWLCDECTGQGPISSLRKARSHVENQHLPDLIKEHETRQKDAKTATDEGDSSGYDIEARRENNNQLEEFGDDG